MAIMGGSTSLRSRIIHAIPGATMADKGTIRRTACGRDAEVRFYEVGPTNDVCLKCRKNLGWPTVVTWESQGLTFTTDFSRKG